MNLNVEIRGEGFPLLCLHGHPGSGRCMSVFTEYLSPHWQTIAPDLRGYGKSRPLGNFSMNDHLNDLEKLLDKLQIKCCLLLGWSLGGILALELALRNPQRYSGLILIATAARPRGSHPRVGWQCMLNTGLAGVINSVIPGWQWNIDVFGRNSLFGYLIQQHTPQAYRYLAREGNPAYLQTSLTAHRALNTALRKGYNRLADLEIIQAPCLMLAGEKDRHITAESSRETAQQLKNCQWHCYQNTAHLFPWEIPKEMLADIDRWLAKHPQVRSPNIVGFA
ncbi:MAG: alpha/beta hydrolase [Oscillatoria sp. PMC 1051.18]|nr:alpha/beta hydrolase [Oscillatoria sp. PMC 1050.18]MEC5030323.1 alpha/beta hydrolase [Oscillatoria sp. PMC 1051.18]